MGVWQDCMNTVNEPNNGKNALSQIIQSKDDISHSARSLILITQKRSKSDKSAVRKSRSLSPRHRRSNNEHSPQTQNEVNRSHKLREDTSKRHKFVISSDIVQTINEDTKCYLNCLAEDTQIALCSFIPYQDLIHLSQSNQLWNNIISDDLVWRICFRVKWPLDEFTYSSDSSCDENMNPYCSEMAFSKFHKSLHRRKKK